MDFDDMFNPRDGESFEDVIKRLMETIDSLTPDDIRELDEFLKQRGDVFREDMFDIDSIAETFMDSSIDGFNVKITVLDVSEADSDGLELMKAALDRLVEDEEYEEAAKLRDQIKEIEEKKF